MNYLVTWFDTDGTFYRFTFADKDAAACKYEEGTGIMTETILKGNRAVIINQQGDRVWANLYVNARNGIEHADITSLRWTGKTIKGARRWATKQLES